MKRKDFHLVIDAFTPESLPMERLARYLREFAVMLGNEAFVHFSRIAEGSADLVAFADETALPKVERRLQEVVEGTASKPAMRAHHDIDELLAEDNAIGHVGQGEERVIEFPGRRRATHEKIGPVRRATTVEGQIFSIGGKDETINVHLRHKAEEVRAEVSITLARDLAPYFLAGNIRLYGEGDWYRIDGVWRRSNFTATAFVPLSGHSLAEEVDRVRETFSGVDPDSFLSAMAELRRG